MYSVVEIVQQVMNAAAGMYHKYEWCLGVGAFLVSVSAGAALSRIVIGVASCDTCRKECYP